MQSSWLVKVFGANYRTTITGVGASIMGGLTALAALPYQLGSVSVWIPPAWKEKVFMWAGVATILLNILKAIFSKANNVTGNSADGMMVSSKGTVTAVVDAAVPVNPSPPTTPITQT